MAYQHRILTFNDVLLPFWGIFWTVVAFFPMAFLAEYVVEASDVVWLQEWFAMHIYENHANWAMLAGLAAILYTVPIHIAFWRRAKDRQIVFYFTFFLGWTGIAWLLGLWLAFKDPWDY